METKKTATLTARDYPGLVHFTPSAHCCATCPFWRPPAFKASETMTAETQGNCNLHPPKLFMVQADTVAGPRPAAMPVTPQTRADFFCSHHPAIVIQHDESRIRAYFVEWEKSQQKLFDRFPSMFEKIRAALKF